MRGCSGAAGETRWSLVGAVAKHEKDSDGNIVLYILLGEVHRRETSVKVPIDPDEVQSGSYLGEDEIVRLGDVYRRSS